MSLREFATHLGVSVRTVLKWEAGGQSIYPQARNQEALDFSLTLAGPQVLARFLAIVEPGRLAAPRHVVTHPVDDKPMVLVDAGSYLRGPDNRPVWLPAYFIDMYPTTNADYRRFVASSGHPAPANWPRVGCPDELLDHPVTRVGWHDAVAYARWADKTLPDELEWEKAARGVDGRVYPWGDLAVAPASVANVSDSDVGTTTPVGQYPAGVSPYGAYDMCGNVWEWTATPTGPGRRRVMGGAYNEPLRRAAPSAFRDAPAGTFAQDTGFRCATAAKEMLELLSI
jgi:formylglycine-generating enzyme required for sulfatase activity